MSQVQKFFERKQKTQNLPSENRKALQKTTPKPDNSRFLEFNSAKTK